MLFPGYTLKGTTTFKSKKQGAPHVSQTHFKEMVDELQTLLQHAVLWRPEWKNVYQV